MAIRMAFPRQCSTLNRFLTLVSAMARRIFGVMTIAYFDDNPTVALSEQAAWSQATVAFVYNLVGGVLAPDKRMPMGARRIYLGQSIDVSAHVEGTVVVAHKPGLLTKIDFECESIIQERSVHSGRYAKLRGIFGWAASSAQGRCGRVGLRRLADVQYSKITAWDFQVEAHLRFLSTLAHLVPPRSIRVGGRLTPSSAALHRRQLLPQVGRHP